MSNEERKAAIREALGHAKVVPVATPKTEGMCCAHCSLKISTVAPYYPPQAPPQGLPVPVNPYGGEQYSGSQYIYSNQLYGHSQNNLQQALYGPTGLYPSINLTTKL